MYKYSKKAEEKFFAQPTLAFLFAISSTSNQGVEYTREKLFNKGSGTDPDSSTNIPDLTPQNYSNSESKRDQKALRKNIESSESPG